LEEYGTYDWVGNKCYEYIAEGKYKENSADEGQLSGGAQNQHETAAALLKQIKTRPQRLSPGRRCKINGGVLKVRLRPPPRIIRCIYPRGK